MYQSEKIVTIKYLILSLCQNLIYYLGVFYDQSGDIVWSIYLGVHVGWRSSRPQNKCFVSTQDDTSKIGLLFETGCVETRCLSKPGSACTPPNLEPIGLHDGEAERGGPAHGVAVGTAHLGVLGQSSKQTNGGGSS